MIAGATREEHGGLVLGTAGRDALVGLAERLDDRAADGAAHDVAGHERGADDGRAEHHPGDDHEQAERDREREGQVADGDAEQALHVTPPRGRRGRRSRRRPCG
jgi:hypothetical protein